MTAIPQTAAASTDASADLLDRLLNFLEPTPVSEQDAADAWSGLEGELPAILDDFYAALDRDRDLRAIYGDRHDQTKSLQARQTAHWKALMTQRPGIAFQGRSIRIAEAHVRIGLPSHWNIAAYGRVLAGAIPSLFAKHRRNPRKAERLVTALVSRAFLDICAAQEGYENGIRRRVEESRERDNHLHSLRSVAETIASINELTLNMAVMQSATDEASTNSQSISAAAEELLTSVEQIAENSNAATARANDTNASVSESIDAMDSVAASITEIARTAETSTQSLSELNAASEQISGFLAVIQTIADQTNLLALNATIEAARAGEAGKGFAVVASEVKSLANQAAKATEDISSRISALKNGMQIIESSLTESRDAVERGQTTIAGANTLIRSVGDQVSDVSTRMQEISSILTQQTETTAEISSNITGVADHASQNQESLAQMNASLQQSNDNFLANARDWFRSDSHRSLVQMAKIDHVMFKKRILDILSGRAEGSAADLPDHHGCRLGKWHDGIQIPEIRNHPAFNSLVAPHQDVHAIGKRILEAQAAGEHRRAFAMLGDLDKASRDVLAGLDALANALDSELSLADARSHVRRPVPNEAAHTRRELGSSSVRVRDISTGGLGVTGDQVGELGETVQVEYQGQVVLGEIAWKRDGQAGIRLLKGTLVQASAGKGN